MLWFAWWVNTSCKQNLYKNFVCTVIISGTLSNWFKVTSGVRQGCLLSPLLFAIIIDWIMRTSNKENGTYGLTICKRCSSRELEVSLKDLDYACDIALLECSRHCLQNSSNKCLLFYLKEVCGIMIGCSNVQVKNIVKSYGAKLSQIKRMKYLPKNVLVEIYYKSVIANVTYCITVWGTCSPPLFEVLEHIHVRAAKLIYNIKDEKFTDEQILQKVGWRKLEYIYKRRILSVMHDIYYNKTPSTLTDMFSKGNNSTTKQRLNFQIKRPRTEQGRTSLLYRGPLTCNLIPH